METKHNRTILFYHNNCKDMSFIRSLIDTKETTIYDFQDQQTCLNWIEQNKFDLMLFISDCQAPCHQFTKIIKDLSPTSKMLGLVKKDCIKIAVEYLKTGVDEIIELPLSSPSILMTTINELFKDSGNQPLKGQKLTRMEIEVVKRIIEGHSNKEIADQLAKSVRTIEAHKSKITRKLNTDNTTELLITARKYLNNQ